MSRGTDLPPGPPDPPVNTSQPGGPAQSATGQASADQPPTDQRAGWTPALRPAAMRAATLWGIDALVLGQGGIAVVAVLYVLFFALPAAALRRRYAGARRQRFKQIGLYVLAAAMVLATIAANNTLARHRAQRVIDAVNAYHAQHQRYPRRLTDITPAHIDSIPAAKLTFIFNEFRYIPTETGAVLFYTAVPPYGRPTYDFASGTWGFVD